MAFREHGEPAEDEDESESAERGPAKAYITPEGHAALRDALRRLRAERPQVVETVAWAAGNGDRSENGDYIYGKKRLREIDRGIRRLVKRLEVVEIVDPARQTNRAQVFFGASVTYLREDDSRHTVTLVGADEIDPERGRISWTSPVARALMRARVGDEVEARTPKGVEFLAVVEIRYP
jgi:transcription elongation factor GreB